MKDKNIHLNPDNPRFIKDDKFKKLCQSIKEFPKMLELRPIIVDPTGLILGGNMRFRAIQELGLELKDEWFKTAESLTAEETRRFIVEDNVGFGEWDWDKLSAEFEKEELEDWGLDIDKWKEDEIVEDEVPEVTENPVSKLGEVYQLGRHRIMCGDSTKIEDVGKLMDGKKADMVFTDPPYGMNLDTDYSKMPGTKTKYSKVIGDDKEFDISFMFNILPSPIYYIWGAEYLYNTIPNFKQGSMIVWAKRQSEAENKVFGSAYELCWVFPKIKKEIWFVRAINQSSERLGVHPTQKPVELGVRAIKDRTEEENIIADLFLGSGSTLIACEQTNRICYGMEIDPRYTDVIRRRYWKFVNNGDDKDWEKNTPLVLK